MKSGSWLLAASALAAFIGTAACKTEAYCFVCEDPGDAQPPPPDSQGTGGSTFVFDGNTGTGGVAPPDAQTCLDTQSDPQNCGQCGFVCAIPGAIAKCVSGVCMIDTCAPGLVDIDGAVEGCECTLTNGGVEQCDGVDNDCDTVIDDGFDLATDENNCGACNFPCAALPNSTVQCLPDAQTVGKCTYTCNAEYTELGGVRSEIGCPYHCPVNPPLAAEICNGIDDNCDGSIDEGDPGANVDCEDNCPIDTATGLHKCQGVCTKGKTSCTGTTTGLVCIGGGGAVGELCDTLDNDCDGQTDEGFNLLTDELNCGRCGVQCQVGDLCTGGICQFTCAPGFKDVDLNPANGCEYACPVFPTQPETCNGIDDDCTGLADDAVPGLGGGCGAVTTCPTPNSCVNTSCAPYQISPNTGSCYGVCSSGGVLDCVGGVLVCEYSNQRATELCNTLDDNCDGRIDEGFNLQQDPLNCGSCGNPCTAPNAVTITCVAGVCTDIVTCAPGYADVDGNLGNGCEYQCPTYPPVGETCNNSDDDCDGTPDNNLTGFGFTGCTAQCPAAAACVTAGNCPVGTVLSSNVGSCYGVCGTDGVNVCQTGGINVCTHPARTTESCDGLDNNCDGRVDEGINKLIDNSNCGTCGAVCNATAVPNAAGAQCVGGTCQATSCQPGYLLQNGACSYRCPVFPTTTETCNGLDDNCDGIVDNSPTDLGPCAENCPGGIAGDLSSCKGICNGNPSRQYVCQSGQRLCQGGTTPGFEICDDLDNDCDGTVDDGFNKQTDPNNCGSCGNKCLLPNTDVHVCVAGACDVGTCAPGFADITKLNGNANGCEYSCPQYPTSPESCDNVDNDCDSLVDALDPQLTAPANFCKILGECAGSAPECQGVNGWRCDYAATVDVSAAGTVLVNEARCDGLDNNCNGQSDESFPLKGKTCSVGTGICATPSTYICDPNDNTQVTCPVAAAPTNARDEDCNGLDDNCDGNIDERTPTGSPSCTKDVDGNTVAAHTCLGWSDPMVKLGTQNVWMYSYEASRPDSTSTEAGISTVRACSRTGRIPWTSVDMSEATAACAAVQDSNGDPMRLCSITEWETGCEAAEGVSSTPLWSYASAPGTYVSGTCNDNNVLSGVPPANGPWATGAGASCYASWAGGGRLYDMSGNVAEWTSTQETVNATTYNRVRGGSYSTFPMGTRCDFNFVLEKSVPDATPAYQNFDLGFRCCSNAAP